jgi:hypothetical protein
VTNTSLDSASSMQLIMSNFAILQFSIPMILQHHISWNGRRISSIHWEVHGCFNDPRIHKPSATYSPGKKNKKAWSFIRKLRMRHHNDTVWMYLLYTLQTSCKSFLSRKLKFKNSNSMSNYLYLLEIKS